VQLATAILHSTQNIKKAADKPDINVGKTMKAKLDVQDPVKGSAPGSSGPHDDLMTALDNQYPGAGFLRGHLLNDNLGGFGIWENMFPITKNANAHHLEGAERWVKQSVLDASKYDAGLNTPDKVDARLKKVKDMAYIMKYYYRDPNDGVVKRNLNPIPDAIVPHHEVRYQVEVIPAAPTTFVANPAALIKASWETINISDHKYGALSPEGGHLRGSEEIKSSPGVLTGLNEKLDAKGWGSVGSGMRSGMTAVTRGDEGDIPGLDGYRGIPISTGGKVRAYKITVEP
jgi:hypothetical protein